MPNFGPFPSAIPPVGSPITTADILAGLNGRGLGLLTPQSDPTKRPIPAAALRPRSQPQAPQSTSGYTPEQVLKSQADTANWFQSRPLAPMAGGSTPAMISGGIANVGNGFMGTYLPRQAEEKMLANQALSERAMKEALGSKDLTGMMSALASSGNPKYQDMAAQQMMQRGLAQESAQEELKRKMDAFNSIISSVEGGQPSAQAAPQSAPPAMPAPAGAVPAAAPDALPQTGAAASMPPPPAEEPVVFRPPPRGKLDPTQRAIIGANIIGIPKEAADRLDPQRFANEAQDKETGKGYGERFQKIMAGRDAAQAKLNDLSLIEHLTLNPDTLMGPGTDAISLRLRRMLAAGGMPTSELQSLNATQLYQSLMGKLALEARNPANGAGMPGAMSDADREFLQKIAGGTENTREANIANLRINQLKAKRDMETARNAAEYAANNGGRIDVHFDRLHDKWAQQNPLFKEKDFAGLFDTTPPGQAAPPAGGPQVGQAAPQPQAQTFKAPQEAAQQPIGTIALSPDGHQMKKVGPGQWAPTTFSEDVKGIAGRAGGVAVDAVKGAGKAMHEGQSLPMKALRELFQGGMSWPRG